MIIAPSNNFVSACASKDAWKDNISDATATLLTGDLDVTNGAINLNGASVFSIKTAFPDDGATVEICIAPASVQKSTTDKFLFTNGSFSSQYSTKTGIGLRYSNSGSESRLYVSYYTGGSRDSITGFWLDQRCDDSIHTIAFCISRKNNKLDVYADGKLVKSVTNYYVSTLIPSNESEFYFGREANDTTDSNIAMEKIYRVRVYQFFLDANQILENANHDKYYSNNAKFLISSENKNYAYSMGVPPTEITPAGALTAETFRTSGAYDLPYGEYLMNLQNPKLLIWSENASSTLPIINAVTNAESNRLPQEIISEDVYFSEPAITGIKSVSPACSDDVLIAFSIDAGTSWKKYDTATSSWIASPTGGMTVLEVKALTEANFKLLLDGVQNRSYRVKYTLPNQSSYAKSLVVAYSKA